MLKFFKFLIAINISLPCFSQFNLVNNPNFENGNPQNINNSSCQYSNFTAFDNDLNDFSHIIIQNQNRTLVPHWIDLSKDTCRFFCENYSGQYIISFPNQNSLQFTNEYNYYFNNKVVLLEQDFQLNFFLQKVKRRSGVITKLKNKLEPNKTYILRYKVMPLAGFLKGKYENGNKLEVHLRQNGGPNTWDNQNNNQKINNICNFSLVLDSFDVAKWIYKECEFNIPSNLDKLEHLVFIVDEGRVAIDDIELFEKCPTEIAIQNKAYLATHNYPIKEQASEILYAGRDVTGNWAQGDVIVHYNADLHFTAGQKIIIGPGFKTEPGAKFIAEISPCSNSSGQRIINDNSTQNNSELEKPNNWAEKQIQISPNPNSGIFNIELAEPQENTTLQIYNTFGQLMLQQQIDTNQHQIDVSTFGKGIYLVHIISSNNEQVIKKVVVQ